MTFLGQLLGLEVVFVSYNVKIYDLGNGEKHVCFFPNYIISGGINKNDDEIFKKSIISLSQHCKHSSISNSSYDSLTQEQKDKFNRLRSVRRSKDSIYKLSLCNDWEFFCTFTFSKSNFRYEYDVCIKRFRQWIANIKKRFCPDLKYLFIVEPHKDGAYHLHGLMSNLGGLPLLKKKNWGIYERYVIENYNFGRNEISPVVDSARISNYITKYITKELFFKGLNKHNYFCSRNLNHPEVSTYDVPGLQIDRFYLDNFSGQYEIQHIYNGKNDTVYLSLKEKSAAD